MRIKKNPDKEIVDDITQKLKENGGYCPCSIEKNDDTRCMCKEFRDQINDPAFEGFCHCKLYYKEK